jgi:hypothetical protein
MASQAQPHAFNDVGYDDPNFGWFDSDSPKLTEMAQIGPRPRGHCLQAVSFFKCMELQEWSNGCDKPWRFINDQFAHIALKKKVNR